VVRNRDAIVVKTDGPGQHRAGPGIAPPLSDPRPEAARFRNLLLVLHKPELLGTDTSVYWLDMGSAPYLSGPTTFHFLWRRS
jgi:hypothetical protein